MIDFLPFERLSMWRLCEGEREVIEIFASAFNLPKSRVNIIKGEKSRHKVVCLEVEGKNALILKHHKEKENLVED